MHNKRVFDFEQVVQDSQAKNEFYHFLQTELNQEPLLFLEQVNKLEKSNGEEAVKIACHVMKTFIMPASPMEINISSESRMTLVSLFQKHNQFEQTHKWVIPEFKTPVEAFARIKDSVMLELKHDTFPRFLRSKIWLDFVQNKSKEYIESISVLKAAVDFHYTDADFSAPVVFDKDFRFMEALAEDDEDWEFRGSNKLGTSVVNSFYGSKNYLPNVSWMEKGCFVKYTVTFPFSLEQCAKAMMPLGYMEQYDPNCKRLQNIAFYSNEELKSKFQATASEYRTSCVAAYRVDLHWPMRTPRRLIAACSAEYKPEREQLMFIMKSVDPPSDMPLKKGWIEAKDLCCNIFLKIDEHRTLFTQIHSLNFGGWSTNRTVMRLACMQRGKDFQKVLQHWIQQVVDNKVKEPDANDTGLLHFHSCNM
jgi:hypothetical protein